MLNDSNNDDSELTTYDDYRNERVETDAFIADISTSKQVVLKDSIDLDHDVDCNKEKSPMCLINELARFNNVSHQYQLIDELGPAHAKTFTVVLKLAENEEYHASGLSIRKAQHAAAAIALLETKLPHPTPKTQRKSCLKEGWPLTPTVELNVLAMKKGEPANYQVYEPRATHGPVLASYIHPTGMYDYRGMFNQRYHFPKGPYTAAVSIGNKQFFGKGRTAQSARHAAAEEALKVMREPVAQNVSTNSINEESKSPISHVHELALKRNLEVKFEVVAESGPSHMPVFVTKCIVGDIESEGEGNGKKLSRRKAAENMLVLLRSLPEPSPSTEKDEKSDKKRNIPRRKKLPFIRRSLTQKSCLKSDLTDDLGQLSLED